MESSSKLRSKSRSGGSGRGAKEARHEGAAGQAQQQQKARKAQRARQGRRTRRRKGEGDRGSSTWNTGTSSQREHSIKHDLADSRTMQSSRSQPVSTQGQAVTDGITLALAARGQE